MNNKESHQVLIIESVKDRHMAQATVLIQAGYSVLAVQPDTIEQLGEQGK